MENIPLLKQKIVSLVQLKQQYNTWFLHYFQRNYLIT